MSTPHKDAGALRGVYCRDMGVVGLLLVQVYNKALFSAAWSNGLYPKGAVGTLVGCLNGIFPVLGAFHACVVNGQNYCAFGYASLLHLTVAYGFDNKAVWYAQS
mgnify:FL=1